MSDKQTHSGEAAASWVEVWFKIEKDADGYPESKSWEGLWAKQRNGVYTLKSVPFYLKNVSIGDEVEAAEGEFLEFQKVVARAGHNTYRLLLSESHRSKLREIVKELEELGLTVETEIGMLLAIDVGNWVIESVFTQMEAWQESGRRSPPSAPLFSIC